MNSKVIVSRVIGISIILFTFIFMAIYMYHHEPIGDDILCYYTGALTYYLDDFDVNLGHKMVTLKDVFDTLYFTYLHWSGRVTGYLLNYFGKLFPRFLTNIIQSLIFIMNSFLVSRLILNKTLKVIENSYIFFISFFVLYWIRSSVYFSYMWTMSSIYEFSMFLCLLYYNLYIKWKKKYSIKRVLVLLVLGLLAGLAHEVYSFLLIVMIGTNWIVDSINKKIKFNTLFVHIFLGIGYLLCFFAPGNFNRAMQTHDSAIKRPYIFKLLSSGYTHIRNLFSSRELMVFISLLSIMFLISIFFYLLKNKFNFSLFLNLILDNVDFLIAGLFEVIIYPVGPGVPFYGLGFWYSLILIITLRVIFKCKLLYKIAPNNKFFISIPIILFICFNIIYSKENYKKISTALTRYYLVKKANQLGLNEIKIPKYDNNLSLERTCIMYLNSQEQYDSEQALKYWGTHLVLENK